MFKGIPRPSPEALTQGNDAILDGCLTMRPDESERLTVAHQNRLGTVMTYSTIGVRTQIKIMAMALVWTDSYASSVRA